MGLETVVKEKWVNAWAKKLPLMMLHLLTSPPEGDLWEGSGLSLNAVFQIHPHQEVQEDPTVKSSSETKGIWHPHLVPLFK